MSINLDTTIFTINLKSHAPLHPGREDWKSLLKRCWEFIPGSTLYGALMSAYITMKGKWDGDYIDETELEEILKSNAKVLVYEFDKKFHFIYRLIGGYDDMPRIRFSPLVPVDKIPDNGKFDGEFYCKKAKKIKERDIIWTQPHHTRHRISESTLESHLFARENHSAMAEYIGFIAFRGNGGDKEKFGQWLDETLNLLSLSTMGGKGKFSRVTGSVLAEKNGDDFTEKISLNGDSSDNSWIESFSPLPLGRNPNQIVNDIRDRYGGNGNDIFKIRLDRIYTENPWRFGYYRRKNAGGNGAEYVEGSPLKNLTYFKRNTRDAFLCISPGPVFKLCPERNSESPGNEDSILNKFRQDFIWGIGDRDYTYLGFGQVIV